MRILLVEDEPQLGMAIKQILTQEAYIVDWVLTGTEAWNYLDSQWIQYTLAIFDWLLPGISGLELCKRLRARNNPIPILILTARDRMEDKVAGLDAGADDYLIKPFRKEELLARLRALQRRSPQFQLQQLKVNGFTLSYSDRTVSRELPNEERLAVMLTMKEFHLLEYFMKHRDQIIVRDRLMNQLWEVSSEPTSNVVAAQIRLLRRKLAEIGGENLIETVYGMGYRLNTTDAAK